MTAPATLGDCLRPSTRKQPRRNVTPRSYSSLLKSDSDTDGEGVVNSPVKNPDAPSSKGNAVHRDRGRSVWMKVERQLAMS